MYRDSTLQSMSPVEKCANFRFEFLECRPDHAEFHPVGDFVLERLTEDRADHSLSPCSVRDVVIVDGEVLREEGVAKGALRRRTPLIRITKKWRTISCAESTLEYSVSGNAPISC
jgi:hypothetical protein